MHEQAGAAGVMSPFESRGARDGFPSEERATPVPRKNSIRR